MDKDKWNLTLSVATDLDSATQHLCDVAKLMDDDNIHKPMVTNAARSIISAALALNQLVKEMDNEKDV